MLILKKIKHDTTHDRNPDATYSMLQTYTDDDPTLPLCLLRLVLIFFLLLFFPLFSLGRFFFFITFVLTFILSFFTSLFLPLIDLYCPLTSKTSRRAVSCAVDYGISSID